MRSALVALGQRSRNVDEEGCLFHRLAAKRGPMILRNRNPRQDRSWQDQLRGVGIQAKLGRITGMGRILKAAAIELEFGLQGEEKQEKT